MLSPRIRTRQGDPVLDSGLTSGLDPILKCMLKPYPEGTPPLQHRVSADLKYGSESS